LGRDIFLSYARKDLDRVEPLARALERQGWSVWWDAALRSGVAFDREIERELAAARCVLVVWTQAALVSDWVRAEAAEALEAGKLVPVFLDAVKAPLRFRNVHGVDLGAWDGGQGQPGFQRLCRDIAELAGPGAPPQADGPAPARSAAPKAPVRRPTPAPAKVQPLPKPRLAAYEPFAIFRDRLKGGGEGPEMVWLPPGEFLMGSPEGEAGRDADEGPQHRVTVSRPFALGRFAVTRGEFAAFVSATGYRTAGEREGGIYVWDGEAWKLDPERNWRSPGFEQTDRHPVVGVDWDDALAYCNWLGGETGRPYRLPSEAEWEYACRAGTTGPFHFGETISTDQANYDGNFPYGKGAKGQLRKGTVEVGSLPANPWGLHEMHGNCWEWCLDWFGDYSAQPVTDPVGPTSGLGRVLRGGGWGSEARPLRSADRSRRDPGNRLGSIGFRLAPGP
jgi:formylglycine-generating enzyme required for sulfatase activity